MSAVSSARPGPLEPVAGSQGRHHTRSRRASVSVPVWAPADTQHQKLHGPQGSYPSSSPAKSSVQDHPGPLGPPVSANSVGVGSTPVEPVADAKAAAVPSHHANKPEEPASSASRTVIPLIRAGLAATSTSRGKHASPRAGSVTSTSSAREDGVTRRTEDTQLSKSSSSRPPEPKFGDIKPVPHVDYSALLRGRRIKSRQPQHVQQYLVEYLPMPDHRQQLSTDQKAVKGVGSSVTPSSTADWVEKHAKGNTVHPQPPADRVAYARRSKERSSTIHPSPTKHAQNRSSTSPKSVSDHSSKRAKSAAETKAPSTVADQDMLDKTVPQTGYRRARLHERQPAVPPTRDEFVKKLDELEERKQKVAAEKAGKGMGHGGYLAMGPSLYQFPRPPFLRPMGMGMGMGMGGFGGLGFRGGPWVA